MCYTLIAPFLFIFLSFDPGFWGGEEEEKEEELVLIC
jgi:hypothetical protein